MERVNTVQKLQWYWDEYAKTGKLPAPKQVVDRMYNGCLYRFAIGEFMVRTQPFACFCTGLLTFALLSASGEA